ncbi:MAG: hypothetical protein AB7G44_06625 [Bacteroidia bacterium]
MAKLFMLSCKKATELVEKKSVAGLSFIEGLKLNLHIGMCSACKAYEKQSSIMDKFLAKQFQSDKNRMVENPELKNQILKKISSEID